MNQPERNYLDNAATSWPKPEAVYRAVDQYQRQIGAAAGRGQYRQAAEAGNIVSRARRGVARLLHVDDPRQIVFTSNGTTALNLAIRGLLRGGDHVVTTDIEHNSVLRPLAALEAAGRIRVSRVPCDEVGRVDPAAIGAELHPQTRLVVLAHASNVTGTLQPVEQVAELTCAQGVRLLVDAAQTAGHVELRPAEWNVDLLATSGHKGLLGPLGTGVLYIRPEVEAEIAPLFEGGTGTESHNDRQPDALPEKFESGNLNVLGLAGLAAAVEYIAEQTVSKLSKQSEEAMRYLVDGLSRIPAVRLLGPASIADRVNVLSLTVEGWTPHDVAAVLDDSYGVQARAGMHCAPRIHSRLGTLSSGGTLRLSPGPFTTIRQLEQVIEAIAAIAASGVSEKPNE